MSAEECSSEGVRVLAQEPLLAGLIGSVIFAVFLAGYCLGSRRSVPAEPFIPAPIFEIPSLTNRQYVGKALRDSPTRGSRAVSASLGRRPSVSDPVRW